MIIDDWIHADEDQKRSDLNLNNNHIIYLIFICEIQIKTDTLVMSNVVFFAFVSWLSLI